MPTARCSCGALSVALTDMVPAVVACHCLDCQRRSGSPFGVGAYYPIEAAVISGPAKEFVRATESGCRFRSYFCPTCGSTVYWKTDKHPGSLGIAVGTLADPSFPGPIRSVFERTRHAWVDIGSASQHFDRGRGG